MQNNQKLSERPEVPPREPSSEKPSIPAKPNVLSYNPNQCSTANDSSLYCESHPIYANSSELMVEDSNVACSEGSITPTNPERSNSPTSDLLSQTKNSSLSASTLTISRSSRPAPPPPVRRTSALSNPNAITLGTLKSVGCNTYEEIQNLSKTYSTYEDINKLTLSLQNLNSTENNPHIYGRTSDAVIYSNTSYLTTNSIKNSEYQNTKTLFESTSSRGLQSGNSCQEDSSGLPLPAPPPEAFSDSDSHHSHHYNKITNVHRQFLETLNTKLGQFKPESHISPRLAKRRSVSLSHNNREDEWNSDSAVPNRSSTQSHSIQQTLMAFMTGNHSRSSSTSSTSSRHRRQSPESGRKKAAFTLASCDRESLMASLNVRLAQKQQNEIAREAAAQAMQRKQSVPDVNDSQIYSNRLQNQQIFSTSALNLANVSQSAPHYQSIGNPIQSVPQPMSPNQQQIYGPVLHQQQQQHIQRRSSQPTMGIKIINTTSRQSTQESANDRQGTRPLTNKLSVAQSNQPPQQHPHSHNPFSTDFYANARHGMTSVPSESSNNLTYNSSQNKFEGIPKNVSRGPAPQESFETAVAARVNSWFNSVQLPPEFKIRRESLMDQIRRGKPLRKVSATNDRSAPKLG